ncbi:sensor histidine kinase [Dyadobacter psychrotolerans]|uniref:histidine kinase n=1 Tax=Dyadobacter psychrotolerans TaxID=2541721 RepID=A0A4R5DFU4_9BACT|nr:HAMP domain-containing sensor histidine kinase [Dyadobacter psychrotolerans]TDE10830.1 HAMP domain-containing histidine kinase [Dyadobacter psychrotolerans]
MDKTSYYFERLVGSGSFFKLETRIFHAVCLALVVCISINIPVALYLQIPSLAVLLSAVVVSAGILYYLSRIKSMHQLSAGVFQVFVNVALVFNYYFNSGINGPTYTIFLLAFLVCVVTSPTKQYYLWLPLNILLVTGLLTVEFLFPETIKLTYPDSQGRYIDMVFSYLIIAGFAFMVTVYIIKAYNKQREELIIKTQDLETANVTKNKLLSVIGHDLKEPIASLQSYLEVLVDFELDEQEKQQIKSQLLAMTKNASMMLSNILLWTRGQMQHFNPDLHTLSVSEALESVISQVQRIADNKQIRFWIDIPAVITVKADRQMFELVVRNILMNAIKFTSSRGNIWLSANIENQQCVICIKDDGIGIPDQLQKDIFSLSVKSQQGTDLERGVGLGLMLCKEFTELQGGEITFKSRLAEGTTFRLSFPVVENANS